MIRRWHITRDGAGTDTLTCLPRALEYTQHPERAEERAMRWLSRALTGLCHALLGVRRR